MNQHPSVDDRLLDWLTEAIEANLQNEQFGVPELAEAARPCCSMVLLLDMF